MPKILDEPISLEGFRELLAKNPGLLIIKFGAEWCMPCKAIEGNVSAWFHHFSNQQIQCVMVDVDESFELYAFMKSKKMVKGIPAILMYKKGNNHYAFDDAVNTSDKREVEAFFQRCLLEY